MSFMSMEPSNQTFLNVFEFHKMPSRQSSKKIRFILSSIENHLGNSISENQQLYESI